MKFGNHNFNNRDKISVDQPAAWVKIRAAAVFGSSIGQVSNSLLIPISDGKQIQLYYRISNNDTLDIH